MDPIKQRIAIAEALGWRIYESNGMTYYEMPGGVVWNYVLLVGQLPDYLNDLNVMHAAEKTLPSDKWTEYWTTLFDVHRVYQRSISAPTALYMVAATAAQRAEAFLKTIGKWEE